MVKLRTMDKNYDHRQSEEKIYRMWEKSGAFKSKGDKPYTILMPPPNANASLHAGHGMYTVDDVMIRFKRMQGFAACWIPGLDHAGIETQYVYEKHLAKMGKSRMDFDRKTLYENIYNFVKENSGLIFEQFKRLGFSADWERSVFTLDEKVLDQVFESFRRMEKEGLVYRSDYMVNYCTFDGTSLAELEVKHEDREDNLYYIKYGPVTVATVRPETMLGDTAVAVHPDDERYKDLIGKEVALPLTDRKIPIISDETVDREFGTGAVKVTPAHDPADFEMGQRHNLLIKQVIDLSGRLTKIAGPYAGMKVKQAREKVVADLKVKGLIEKVNEHYKHAVTVCYKCGRDLEPTVIPNWFVKVAPLKPAVIKAVKEKQTKFYPKRFEKQFLDWMEIMHDWPISRQIAWGIRLPVWYSIKENWVLKITFLDKDGKRITGWAKDLLKNHSFGEIESGLQEVSAPVNAIYKISQTKPTDDSLQETDTFDTWFSSGQWALVALKEEEFTTRFPTDLLGTLSDILKFWVSRMMMFSLYWKGDVPFRQVYLWSMVTDAKGQKMSKSRGNVVNPIELIDKYGADAFRMTLMLGTGQGSKVVLAEDKVRGMRNFANKIWNAARFVREAQERDSSTTLRMTDKGDEEFTKNLNNIVFKMTKQLDELKIGLAAETVYNEFWHWFCDEAIEENKARVISVAVLGNGLATFLKLLHPFVPFVTEAVWQELKLSDKMLIEEGWPAHAKMDW